MKELLADMPSLNDRAAYIVAVQAARAEGRPIQSSPHYLSAWGDCPVPFWHWAQCDYRVKPVAKFRDWTHDDVPLGAEVRLKNCQEFRTRSLIEAVTNNGEVCFRGSNRFHDKHGQHGFPFSAMRELFEWRLSGSTHWDNCEVAL